MGEDIAPSAGLYLCLGFPSRCPRILVPVTPLRGPLSWAGSSHASQCF